MDCCFFCVDLICLFLFEGDYVKVEVIEGGLCGGLSRDVYVLYVGYLLFF